MKKKGKLMEIYYFDRLIHTLEKINLSLKDNSGVLWSIFIGVLTILTSYYIAHREAKKVKNVKQVEYANDIYQFMKKRIFPVDINQSYIDSMISVMDVLENHNTIDVENYTNLHQLINENILELADKSRFIGNNDYRESILATQKKWKDLSDTFRDLLRDRSAGVEINENEKAKALIILNNEFKECCKISYDKIESYLNLMVQKTYL